MLYELYLETGDPSAQQHAIAEYESAREAWAKMAARAASVYLPDVTFGETAVRRGTWADRLPAINWDLAVMRAFPRDSTKNESALVREVLNYATRPSVQCEHSPIEHFSPGNEITVAIRVPDGVSAKLLYRHVNQAERWQTAPVVGGTATIDATYTRTPFGIQYYFELRRSAASAWLYPGFNADLANQPYFVISQGSTGSAL